MFNSYNSCSRETTIENSQFLKLLTAFKGAVVNWALLSLHEGSLEIKLTVDPV